jgi:beta-phosphoglucomutase-like phosphatase (HAD superfamily)
MPSAPVIASCIDGRNEGFNSMSFDTQLPRYTGVNGAVRLLGQASGEYAVLENPAHIYPRYEVVPLAPVRSSLDDGCAAVLLDMDGTTTTTEVFCCRAMEEALRRMSGADREMWPGLDPSRDYPALIGYSGAENMRYLFTNFGPLLRAEETRAAFVEAAAWCLGPDADPAGRGEVRALLRQLGLGGLEQHPRFQALACLDGDAAIREAARLSGGLPPPDLEDRVTLGRVGLVIYARQYHRLLASLDTLPPGALVSPLPGVGVFVALVTGRLGAEAGACAGPLCAALEAGGGEPPPPARARETLAWLGRYFEAAPAKTAVITSSSAYETGHVLRHVFRGLRAEAGEWPVTPERRETVCAAFADPETFYDAIVTSSETAEMRLKPCRDPYSQALHRLGLAPGDFHRVAGFEDTEPGIVSLRAAGVGCAAAMPFAGTEAHDFRAAAHVAYGGLPEVLLNHALFMRAGLPGVTGV